MVPDGDSPSNISDIILLQCPEAHNAEVTKQLLARRKSIISSSSLSITELMEESRCDDKEKKEASLADESHVYEKILVSGNFSEIKESGEMNPPKLGKHQPEPMGKETEDIQIQEPNQVPRMERRTSTRLRKELTLTTEEMRMGQKRNLEGTNLDPKKFFLCSI